MAPKRRSNRKDKPVTTPMTTLAEAAAAALEAQRLADAAALQLRTDELIAACRAVLCTLAGSSVDVAAMTVAHVDVPAAMVVLGDGTATVAVYEDGAVYLVQQVDDQWQGGRPTSAKSIKTLAELGAALAGDA